MRVGNKSGLAWVLAVCLVLLSAACTRQADVPRLGSEQYQKLCSAFYLGLAALQSGEDINARKGLVEATQIAPGEPAGWLNLGLLQFRQQDFEGAFQSVSHALTLAADNSRVEALLGVIESRRGKQAEAIGHLTRAVSLDGHNLKAAFALAQETERESSPASDERAQKLFESILAVQPNNVAVLLEDVRLAAKRGDAARVKDAVKKLEDGARAWPDAARQQLAGLQTAADGNVRQAAIQAQFLKNVLVRAPAYRQSLDEVRTPATSAGEPFLKFFKLPSPRSSPDEADRQLRFEAASWKGASKGFVKWLGAASLDSQSSAIPVWIDDAALHVAEKAMIPFPAGAVVGPHTVVAVDLNYDFKTDFVLASSAGLKMFEQADGGAFRDVTSASKLPAPILNGHYLGAWAFDFDLDGDLDLVVGAKDGAALVLRNNGDGSFAVEHPFAGVTGIRDFASADVDGDGDPDVAVIDGQGGLLVFANERLGDYRKRTLPLEVATVAKSLSAADVNGDGLSDFVVLRQSGDVLRLSDQNAGKSFTAARIAHVKTKETPAPIILADLDNNGALDLAIGDQVFLGDGKSFTAFESNGLKGDVADAADLDSNGRMELLTLMDGQPAQWQSRGSKNYHWQTVRPIAARTNGDQRMNSFGVGGEIEVRADLLTQKQIIHGPNLHFGMGSHHGGTEFARIGWPNGLIQTEFNLKPDQTLMAEQRLKGSCPYLFAWDGAKMRFLKDVGPMSGALGAHDADGTLAPVRQTREWFSINGDALRARDGLLRLSVTDEYWESYFIDQYELLAVDHPRGSRVFVDERVAAAPVPQKVYVTGPLKAFVSVREEAFAKDTYAGIGRDHAVELTLPDDTGITNVRYLIAEGSLRPWDDSTLVALNQSSHAKPKDLSLEVRDDAGAWKMVKSDLGVPAGRRKTIVIDLREIGPHKTIRLRTNLAIEWDRLSWADALPDSSIKISKLPLAEATLRHRGFSAVAHDTPDYRHVVESGDRWPALEGSYTRYGDVAPLLEASDNRYVITTSGDELQLAFHPKLEPAPDVVRDYVFAGDGWIKEGDYSFHSSQALLPLPYQGLTSYSGKAQNLESEKAYRMHPEDWQIFHTRYLTSDRLRSALWR